VISLPGTYRKALVVAGSDRHGSAIDAVGNADFSALQSPVREGFAGRWSDARFGHLRYSLMALDPRCLPWGRQEKRKRSVSDGKKE